MASNHDCSFCKKHFPSISGLTGHLQLYEPCHLQLLLQVPPIPSVILNRNPNSRSSFKVGNDQAWRSGRYAANEDSAATDINCFPDDMSDVEIIHPVDHILPTGFQPSGNILNNSHSFFRLPSEIVNEVQNLNLFLEDDNNILGNENLLGYNQSSIHFSIAFPVTNPPPWPLTMSPKPSC